MYIQIKVISHNSVGEAWAQNATLQHGLVVINQQVKFAKYLKLIL